MNGRESKYTRIILSDESKRQILTSKIKKSESIIGTTFEIEDKTFVITTGGLSHIDTRVQNFKHKILDELSTH